MMEYQLFPTSMKSYKDYNFYFFKIRITWHEYPRKYTEIKFMNR